jgi:hypothetical protein
VSIALGIPVSAVVGSNLHGLIDASGAIAGINVVNAIERHTSR